MRRVRIWLIVPPDVLPALLGIIAPLASATLSLVLQVLSGQRFPPQSRLTVLHVQRSRTQLRGHRRAPHAQKIINLSAVFLARAAPRGLGSWLTGSAARALLASLATGRLSNACLAALVSLALQGRLIGKWRAPRVLLRLRGRPFVHSVPPDMHAARRPVHLLSVSQGRTHWPGAAFVHAVPPICIVRQ